jgi:hypothetical protein
VAQVSGITRLALWATALAQVAAGIARRHRWMKGVAAAAEVFLSSLGRVLHLFWLQVAGLFFLAFAVVGSLAARREYDSWVAGKSGIGRVLVALCFSLVFAWFGLTSFWRAKRK